jgi:adenylosuccinate synthase
MRARVVIGANFGDEGKGLVTDYLCSTEGAGMVVRFNGGAQAGHTVVTPDGLRHIFSHFGAGTMAGVPTFLSQFFICNPLLFFQELDRLHALGIAPTVYAHPECIVTTFADMLINQRLEDKRGKDRHGSCGVGVRETVERSLVPELKITMSDLWNGIGNLDYRLEQICARYAAFRTGKPIDEPEMVKAFVAGCWKFAEAVHPLGIGQCKDPIFEGAQGLLLDQNNREFFPHLTSSNTGMQNVRVLCDQAGIKDADAYYVSRTYLTRHGAGPLPGQDDAMSFEDETNIVHAYQGTMRFAPLDADSLIKRCTKDYGSAAYKLVLTHADQLQPNYRSDLVSYGETRDDLVLDAKRRLAAH